MADDRRQQLDAERLWRLQRYEQEFEARLRGVGRWAPHRRWRATLGDNLLALLGAIILIVAIVVWIFF